ncbi:PqqD family peptide modification chaperone [Nocardioides sp.]|uniref:PqqD family peptide modification chaperone n=1 Tax=Nocardioides sp. TaxID=35761 RepID=UPI00262F7CD2|nr:PqqD family peptide modification chaperone [Nocardioides sp.]MCW2738229.1 hypothetical protein [Nocardioides sp.]
MIHRYRIADDVAWVSQEDLDGGSEPTAYLTRVPGGPPILLEGSGCVVWLALAEGGTMEELTAAAAAMSGSTLAEVTEDVETLIDQLVAIRVVRED